jgi:hypothetical protein
VGGVIYMIGGGTGGAMTAVEAFQPATNTWSSKAAMPTPRTNMGAAVLGSLIYVYGGINSSVLKDQVEVYDTVANSWTTRANLPFPWYYHTGFALNGALYSLGGNSCPGTGCDLNSLYQGQLFCVAATPSPSPSISPTPTTTPTSSPTPSPSSTPTITLTFSLTVTRTNTPVATPSWTASSTPSVTTSPTPTFSSTPVPAFTATVSATATYSPTSAPTAVPPTPVNSPTPDFGVISIPNLKNYHGGDLTIQIKGAAPGPSGLVAQTHLPGGGVVVLDNLGTSLSNGTTVIRWNPSQYIAPGTPFTLRLTDANGRVFSRTFVYVE